MKKSNHKICKSVKQAAVCKYLGCDVELKLDNMSPSKCEFRISPRAAAEQAIVRFESGESFPGRPLMDVHSELHTAAKHFLFQYRLLSDGKEIVPMCQ
jgi:hypothetical protein